MPGVADSLKAALRRKPEKEPAVSTGKPEEPSSPKPINRPFAIPKKKEFELLPVRVSHFDDLLEDKGIERGLNVLLSGGAGTGKTTFAMQSLYNGALAGEKGVYISFEEDPEKIKHHMKKNFGWDFYELEKKGLVSIIKFDPGKIARQVEEVLVKEAGMLRIKVKEMELPLVPDRIAIDSVSALAIEFENEKSYRKYVKEMFHMLQAYDSVNYIITETEQNPKAYSRTGVEEFVGDGVVVLYNLKIAGVRKNALEILKLRSGKHVKEMVPYALTETGFDIYYKERQF